MDLVGQESCNNNNNINPLDQDLILRLVLEHVGKNSLTDLKNCRLVNHSWNRAAVQVLEEQHDFALELDLKKIDEFKNLLWRTQLSRLKSENRELKSLRLSLKLNSLINISEIETVEFVVGAASEMGKAGQMLQLNPHLRVAFMDYTCHMRDEKGDQEQTQMVLVNQELFNLLSLTSAALEGIAISTSGCSDLVVSLHFDKFEFDSSLTFPYLTFVGYKVNYLGEEKGGDEMGDLTRHVVSIIQGAPKLTKLNLYLWDGHLKGATNSLHAIMNGCADRLEELELEVSLDAEELDAVKALSEIKFPALRVFKIIDGFYYANKWFNLFLKNNCPLLERLQVEWSSGSSDEEEDEQPMLLEFPTLPNIIHFSFDPVVFGTSSAYLERVHTAFSTLMTGLPSLKSLNFSIKLLLMLGAHLKKSGHLAPSPAIYPVFPNISTLEIIDDHDEDVNDDGSDDGAADNTTDLINMTSLVYRHTFPNIKELIIKPRNWNSSMQRVGLVIEFLCRHPGIQTLEIQKYSEPWLDRFVSPNQSLQGLKTLKLFAPARTGMGVRLDPFQLLTRYPALEFLQFGKQIVSTTQIQFLRDVLKIFEDPVSN